MGVIGLYPDRLQSTTPRQFSSYSHAPDANPQAEHFTLVKIGKTYTTCGLRV